jgi:16S rRNA (guanine966-N2)-methyltransferase
VNQTIRIIGGLYRGRKLSFPKIAGLRPTPDRVRETLFNWLMADIVGARCLDAFAGSGALGFEALSRGAGHCVMVESSSTIHNNLQQLAKELTLSRLTLIHDNAVHYLQHSTQPFDLVFLDPPFASNYINQCINIFATSMHLKSGGKIYLESAKQAVLDSNLWLLKKSKKAGQVFYELYERK